MAGKTPTQIVSLSVKAFHHQRSFHFVTRTVQGSHTQTQVGDVSKTAATETVAAKGSLVVQAIRSRNVAYIRAGKELLQSVLGLSAATATQQAGKWISVQKGDAAFNAVAGSLAPTAAIQLFVPEEPNLHVGGATQLGGQSAVAVVGSTAATPQAGETAVVTLFVSTTAPYLPLGGTLVVTNTDRNHTVVERQASLYGKWNESVRVEVPKNATPVSSLTGG